MNVLYLMNHWFWIYIDNDLHYVKGALAVKFMVTDLTQILLFDL